MTDEYQQMRATDVTHEGPNREERRRMMKGRWSKHPQYVRTADGRIVRPTKKMRDDG